MRLELTSSNEAACGATWDLSVVIACEDSATAAPACEVLELVELNLKDEARLFYQWWNFEVLAVPTLRELAAVEAATADIIIIGVHEARALPEMVTDWMNLWLPLRSDRPGALVAVLDSDLNQQGASPGILSQLTQAAAAGQMDFFATRAKEKIEVGMTGRVSDVVRQFVMARKNGAPHGLPGAGRVPANMFGAAEQFHQARL